MSCVPRAAVPASGISFSPFALPYLSHKYVLIAACAQQQNRFSRQQSTSKHITSQIHTPTRPGTSHRRQAQGSALDQVHVLRYMERAHTCTHTKREERAKHSEQLDGLTFPRGLIRRNSSVSVSPVRLAIGSWQYAMSSSSRHHITLPERKAAAPHRTMLDDMRRRCSRQVSRCSRPL